VVLVAGLIAVPRMLGYVARFKSNEMLLITVLGLCFGVSLLAAKLGYSVALGAFIIGAVIAEAREIHRIEALIERLAALPLAERARLPGMEPKRADVIVAGAVVVAEAMALTGFERLTVSDRGVRWGLVHELLSGRPG